MLSLSTVACTFLPSTSSKGGWTPTGNHIGISFLKLTDIGDELTTELSEIGSSRPTGPSIQMA